MPTKFDDAARRAKGEQRRPAGPRFTALTTTARVRHIIGGLVARSRRSWRPIGLVVAAFALALAAGLLMFPGDDDGLETVEANRLVSGDRADGYSADGESAGGGDVASGDGDAAEADETTTAGVDDAAEVDGSGGDGSDGGSSGADSSGADSGAPSVTTGSGADGEADGGSGRGSDDDSSRDSAPTSVASSLVLTTVGGVGTGSTSVPVDGPSGPTTSRPTSTPTGERPGRGGTRPSTTKPRIARPATSAPEAPVSTTRTPATTFRPGSTRPTTTRPTTTRPTTTERPVTTRPQSTTPVPTTRPEPSTTVPTPSTTSPGPSTTVPGGGVVVWEDGFDSLDRSRWMLEHSTYGDGNNELQCYRPENVSVSGGRLVLRAVTETYTCPNGSTRLVTSGMVRSRGVSFGPGQSIEFRVKLSPGDEGDQGGLWPAVWSSGWAGGGWPRGGELDYLEVMTANDPKRSVYSIHYAKPDGSHGVTNKPVYGSENFSASWHTVRFDYGHNGQLAWYLDGALVHRVTDVNTAQGYPTPFDQATNEIKINLALGGRPGPLAPGAVGSRGATFEVDYIRVTTL